MRRREQFDPLVHERFERVWPTRESPDEEAPGQEPLGPETPGRGALGPEALSQEALGLEALGPEVLSLEALGREALSQEAPRQGLFADRAGDAARPGVALWPPLRAAAQPIPVAPARAVLASLNPGRRAVRALAVVAVVVVVIAAFLAWRSQPHAEVVPASVSAAAVPAITDPVAGAPGPPVSPPMPSAPTIVVAISGRVRHPGLVHLPPGARVADAIEAAGGAVPGTDLSFVNLARKLSDGELIVIGVTPSPGSIVDGAGSASDPSATAGALVDINTAGEAQLDTLPGIGPALAQRIIDYRTQHGTFHSVNELEQVPGIGEAKFAEIKDLVTT